MSYRHLTKFNNHEEYVAFRASEDFVQPNVSYKEDTGTLQYNKSSDSILTFVAIEPNSTVMLTKFIGADFTGTPPTTPTTTPR